MLRLGVTDVVCAAGFSPTFVPEEDRRLAEAVDYLGTLKLITAAEAAKLPGRFVLVSSLGVNALSSSSSAKLLDSSLGNVLVQKAAAEKALKAVPSTGLDWTIVRPGLLLKETTQGGILLGPEDRWTGADAERDRQGLGPPVKCASPFLASSGAVCAATRRQVAEVCVAALTGEPSLFSRRVVEVVARPDVPIEDELQQQQQQQQQQPQGGQTGAEPASAIAVRRTRSFRVADPAAADTLSL